MNLQANHTPIVTPPIAHATCRNPDHRRTVYSSTITTREDRSVNPGHTLSTHSISDGPPSVAASGTISTPRRNSQSEKNEIQNSGRIENQQLTMRDPPKPQYNYKRSPYCCTSARFCLSTFRRTAGASWNTRDTGSQELSASSSPSHAALTTNSSPLASRLIAEMPRIW